MPPIPITILTGFLGSGKTTILLNLLPQLPPTYKIALLKNEFGDVAVDSQLASQSAVSGVRELLNGCICCNLVGQLGDALEELVEMNSSSSGGGLDRIVVETSGSAYPATLVLEVNRLARESVSREGEEGEGEKGPKYILDGVICVIDAENWQGYEDTSYTARMQAKYTDLVVLNKWELAGERRVEECLDRLGDLELEVPIPVVRSEKGWVDKGVLIGLDGKLANSRAFQAEGDGEDGMKKGADEHGHGHQHDHQSEVEVLSLKLPFPQPQQSHLHGKAQQLQGIHLPSLQKFLITAPKDEIYRIKGLLFTTSIAVSSSSSSEETSPPSQPQPSSSNGSGIRPLRRYILNWAFGRWTYTPIPVSSDDLFSSGSSGVDCLSLTVVTARGESEKWRRRILERGWVEYEGEDSKGEGEGEGKVEFAITRVS